MELAIVTAEHCYLRKTAGSSEAVNESTIEDEIFSGWAVRLFPETEENGWIRAETHYGYQGFVKRSELRPVTAEELLQRQEKERYLRMDVPEADLRDKPDVLGLPLELLLKNAFVELLERDQPEGWSRIRTAAGREGYVHSRYLVRRAEDDDYLLEMARREEDLRAQRYFRRRFENMLPDEGTLRQNLVASAMRYLGTQYRWGGKSSQGLDCSGLVFMSYFENGILVYRDAAVKPEYPGDDISVEELKPGDMIFFPGHVAMYMGDGHYIHSTAYAPNACVTINSLRPEDPDYREDLPGKITGCASVFAAKKQSPQFDWTSLTEKLEAMPGRVSVLYRELYGERRSFGFHEQEPHIAASVIKLFLMAAVFQCFEEGRFSPQERIRIPKESCVPSCGVLTYLQDEPEVMIRDLTELMIIVSDNTAANILFDLVGEEYLASFLHDTLGLKQTSFNRKMFDAVRAAQGIENYVTATDAAWLLEEIYEGRMVSREASRQMYEILTHQRLNGKIPFFLHTLPQAPVIAHKTGEDGGITHDVGIIAGEKPFVLCFLGSETDVPEYERLMAQTALELYEA